MTPSGTTHYVYDLNGRLLVEASSTGDTIREYIWLDDMPLAIVADVDTVTPKLYYVHADHLNRPIKMTDENKSVVWDAIYKPFGEVHSITGSAANNLRFPGQYFQLEAGLHYNWHRHYDPTTGRYLQPDPLGFVDGPSIFAYARSSPTQLTDEPGLQGRRGGGSVAITPVQGFYNYYYQQLVNQVRRYDPQYTEVTSRNFQPRLQQITQMEQLLRDLQRGLPPTGGVYGLRNPSGEVCYVGRTNDLARRELEQVRARPGLEFEPIFRTNDPMQQRGMEQRILDALSPNLNQRNAVGSRNPNLEGILNSITGIQVPSGH